MTKAFNLLTACGSCQGCKHWRRVEGDTELVDYGECHRFPPQVLFADDGDGNPCVVSVFPEVNDVDFCGEFSPSN